MYETSDLALAAYLLMRGLKLFSAQREAGGRYQFRINDPDNIAPAHEIDFINSECAIYDHHLRTLRSILKK